MEDKSLEARKQIDENGKLRGDQHICLPFALHTKNSALVGR